MFILKIFFSFPGNSYEINQSQYHVIDSDSMIQMRNTIMIYDIKNWCVIPP